MMTRYKDILIPLFFGFAGILPHILFSLDLGRFAWMEYAWDENTYAAFTVSGNIEMHRMFGASISKVFLAVFGGVTGAMWAMDFFLPIVAAVIALKIVKACGIEKNVFLPATLLLMSVSLLSFSDINFWGKWLRFVSPFATGYMPELVREYIGNLMVTFFQLFKSPDPQASLIVVLLFMLVFLKGVKGAYLPRNALWFFPLLSVLPFTYVTMGLSLIVFGGAYALSGAVLSRDIGYGKVLAVFMAGAAWWFFIYVTRISEGSAATLIYTARAPLLSASTFWCIAGMGYVLWSNNVTPKTVFAGRITIPQKHLLALAAFAVPLITLNQQIFTGVMIQTRNWEFYANYIFVAFGIILLLPELVTHVRNERLLKHAKYISPVLAVAIVVAQFRGYDRFHERNLEVHAVAAAIKECKLESRKILLASPAAEAGLVNLLGTEGMPDVMSGHLAMMYDVGKKPPPDTYSLKTMTKRDIAFAMMDLRDMTPEEFEKHLRRKIDWGTCDPDMLYFYDVMDCMGALSDFRATRPDKLRASVDVLVSDYTSFRADKARKSKLGKFLYLTTKRDEKRKAVATGTAGHWKGGITAYAYPAY